MRKKSKNKKLRFWAGFVDNKMDKTLEYYGDRDKMPAIYTSKVSAKKHYKDVRLVEVKVISQ